MPRIDVDALDIPPLPRRHDKPPSADTVHTDEEEFARRLQTILRLSKYHVVIQLVKFGCVSAVMATLALVLDALGIIHIRPTYYATQEVSLRLLLHLCVSAYVVYTCLRVIWLFRPVIVLTTTTLNAALTRINIHVDHLGRLFYPPSPSAQRPTGPPS